MSGDSVTGVHQSRKRDLLSAKIYKGLDVVNIEVASGQVFSK